jgi:hypothetical protein
MGAIAIAAQGRKFQLSPEQQAALATWPELRPYSKFVSCCVMCATACVGYEPLAGSPAYAPCRCCADIDAFFKRKAGASSKPPMGTHVSAPLDEVLARLKAPARRGAH